MSTEQFEKFISDVLGAHLLVDNEFEIFVKLMADQLSAYWVDINALPELRDIDKIPDEFLNQLSYEYSLKLPQDSGIDLREFIKESKSWYSGKGTTKLYDYLGSLTGTEINIFETAKLIFRTSNPNCRLSGTSNPSSVPLSHENSKLARIRDGIKWAYFVYLLDIRGIQSDYNINALYAMLKLNHPAGTQYFSNFSILWQLEFIDEFVVDYGVLV